MHRLIEVIDDTLNCLVVTPWLQVHEVKRIQQLLGLLEQSLQILIQTCLLAGPDLT